MTATEAYNKLVSEGGNPISFFIGNRGVANDAIGLSKEGKYWRVYYTERGLDSDPMFMSEDESQAAEYFYKKNTSSTAWHLVGLFKEEANALELEADLLSIDIKTIRNDIPSYDFTGDSRYRVFVTGPDIFPTQSKIGTELLTDIKFNQ